MAQTTRTFQSRYDQIRQQIQPLSSKKIIKKNYLLFNTEKGKKFYFIFGVKNLKLAPKWPLRGTKSAQSHDLPSL